MNLKSLSQIQKNLIHQAPIQIAALKTQNLRFIYVCINFHDFTFLFKSTFREKNKFGTNYNYSKFSPTALILGKICIFQNDGQIGYFKC